MAPALGLSPLVLEPTAAGPGAASGVGSRPFPLPPLISVPCSALQGTPCSLPPASHCHRTLDRARTPGLLGPTVVSGQGDMGFARTRGVRRQPQPSPMAPRQPRPVRVPCHNRPRSALFCRASSVLTAHPAYCYFSTLVKEGRLFRICHRGCFPGGLAGWAGPGASRGPASRGTDPRRKLPECLLKIKTSVLTLL